ncbi:MAG: hypothetical protein ACJ74Q_15105 [Pyrinomonadaceae bacterium]
MNGKKTKYLMSEAEQASIRAAVAAKSRRPGPKSTELLSRTTSITFTLSGNDLMRALPDFFELSVTSEKDSGGDGFHITSFEFDEDFNDIFEEVDQALFKERLARYAAENAEDIFLDEHELDWRD